MLFHCYFGARKFDFETETFVYRYAIEEPYRVAGAELAKNYKYHYGDESFFCELECRVINSIFADVNLYIFQELADESQQFYENCKIEYYGEPGWLNQTYDSNETAEDSPVIILPYYNYEKCFYYGKRVIHPNNVFNKWRERGFPVTYYSGYILNRNINDGWFNLLPYYKNFTDDFRYYY